MSIDAESFSKSFKKKKESTETGEPFEVKCVKIIHRCLFPYTPWKDVVGRLDSIDYPHYRELIQDNVGHMPSIQFDKHMKLWDLPLRDILHKRASSMKFWDAWTREEYSMYVFPVVNTPAIITFYYGWEDYYIKEEQVPRITLRDKNGGRYILTNLEDYMTYVYRNGEPSIKEATLNLED